MFISSPLPVNSRVDRAFFLGKATSLRGEHWTQNHPESELILSGYLTLETPFATVASVHVVQQRPYNALQDACMLLLSIFLSIFLLLILTRF